MDWRGAFLLVGGGRALDLARHGLGESLLMPYDWRIVLADGQVLHGWYTHHPALNTVLMSLTLTAFGHHAWSVRLPWVVFSVLALLGFRSLVRTVWDESTALLGTLLFAVIPLAAYFGSLPWVDGAIVWLSCLLYRRYVLWGREGRLGHLAVGALYVFAGGLFDWTMHLSVAAVGVHAAGSCWHCPRGTRARFAGLLLLPIASALSIAVHFAHMLLVLPPGEVTKHGAGTLEFATTLFYPISFFLREQGRYLVAYLTWPVLIIILTGLLRRGARTAQRRLSAADGLLLMMALPGFLYVGLFPARSVNHSFFLFLSMPFFAALTAVEIRSWGRTLRRRGDRSRLLVPLAVAALVTWCVWKDVELWRDSRSDALVELARAEWLAPILSDPGAVLLATFGYGMALSFYSEAPILNVSGDVAKLERQRRQILSRLGPRRRVVLLFDLVGAASWTQLHAYLTAHAPSQTHLELATADPPLGFELFDLTEWVRE